MVIIIVVTMIVTVSLFEVVLQFFFLFLLLLLGLPKSRRLHPLHSHCCLDYHCICCPYILDSLDSLPVSFSFKIVLINSWQVAGASL